MASVIPMGFCKLLLFLALLSSMEVHFTSANEFDVGEEEGWVVPSPKDTNRYNKWASKNRFRIGDIVRFRYKKDSVMVVSEDDYEHCNSLHPTFFSNDGNTEYKLDHSGTFYFISGVTGHCERGQKMIIKVLSQEEAAPAGSPPGNQTATTPSGPAHDSSSGSGSMSAMVPTMFFFVFLIGSLFF